MPELRKRLEVILRPQDAALALGGQSPAQYGGHKGTARDDQGRPIIPATALRGALRLELERLLRGMDPQQTACNANREESQEEPCPCPVCRLFGESGTFTGALRLEDAVLEEPPRGDPAAARVEEAVLRPQVAVERRRRAAADQHLLMLEATPVFPAASAPTFRASAYLIPRGPEDDEAKLEEDLRHLRAACRALRALGSGKARGLGWVECTLEETAGSADSSAADASLESCTALRVTFEALAPLHFGQGPPMGFFHRSQNHAAGSTVRGALAFALIERDPQVTETAGFQALFGPDSPVSFGSARAAVDRPHRTRRKCRPGGHVFNDLVPEVLRRQAVHHGLALAVDRACAQEGCTADKTVPCEFTSDSPGFRRRVRSRVALNRRTATAMDAKLYSMEVLEPRQRWDDAIAPLRLRAEIRGLPPEGLALLQNLQGEEVWLGGKRSKGLGRCRVELAPLGAPPIGATKDAIRKLDASLREGWRALTNVAEGDIPALLKEGEQPLAILLTEPWQPDTEPRAAHTGPLEGLRLLTAFVALEEQGRFGAVEAQRYSPPAHLPCGEEPPQQVVSAGSLYVYAVPKGEMKANLEAWLHRGAEGGDRHRERGWGRFTIHGLKPDTEEDIMTQEHESNILAEQKGWLVAKGDEVGELAKEKGDWKSQIQGMAEAARRETEPAVLLNLLRYQATRNKNWRQGTDVFTPLETTMQECVEKAAGDPKLAVLLIQHLLAYTYRAYTYHYEQSKGSKRGGEEAA